MKKTTFKVILRMPNYYNDGFLQIDGEHVLLHLTNDKGFGFFEDGLLAVNLDKQVYIREGDFIYPITKRENFIIQIPELYSPTEYEFKNRKEEDCTLEFVSVDNSYNFESEGYS